MAVVSSFTSAGGEQQRLIELLEPLASSTGQFKQITKDASDAVIQSSEGTFAIQQPGKFMWRTSAPYEQLLVSDGQTIWLYDPDLEQVTIKPASGQKDQLPIRILSGDFDLLGSEFSIQSGAATGSQQVFSLRPLAPGSLTNIDLVFDGSQLVAMHVQDASKTVTQFEFVGRRDLTTQDEAQFKFQIPEGADVFYDE